MRWLENHLAHNGDGCLAWPYARYENGYAQTGTESATRAMCRLAHGEPPTAKHEAAHRCGKGREGCVNPRHLYWATSAQNEADKVRHGTAPRGEKNPYAKLTEAAVREIRSLEGTMPRHKLAEKFNISQSQIYRILLGQHWRHVQDQPAKES
jgi:hypothetical protein